MNLAEISIRRPTFITCVVLLMLAVGLLAKSRLGVDLFPDVTFPVVTVTTPYPGAGPAEIETLVTKPLEDEVGTLSGLKRLSSVNQEGVSILIAEFSLETDVKFAEQQIRDRVSAVKRKLPNDVKESVIRRIDPSDQPVVILSLSADLPQAKLYDLASEMIKPKLEQVTQVGLVDIVGGRKREIQVTLDRDKLKRYELPVSLVAQRLSAAGENVPLGKVSDSSKEVVFRSLGQFNSLKDIGATIVNFLGGDVPVRLNEVAKVVDTLEDEKSRAFVNGDKALLLSVFKQSGSNTIAVVDGLLKRVDELNKTLTQLPGAGKLSVVRDSSKYIRANVDDVNESIIIGVVLAVVVVFFFLGSGRSTIITGLALPNSLIGAFILMAMAGFTINLMTLLALSLSVGLLVDDAIVVRENIFRHLEMGKKPIDAAIEGTGEVRLAVIATTMTVIAVFGPVGFLKGVVGQFFKQFGLTICFAMIISLFDALTIAPMLSAYFAGKSSHQQGRGKGIYGATVGRMLEGFNNFQNWLEVKYTSVLQFTVRRPLVVLGISFAVFLVCMSTVSKVSKTFLPPQDAGEFSVGFDLPPGTSLDAMGTLAQKVDELIRKHPEVAVTSLTVGNKDGESNVADIYVRLVPSKERKINTIAFKDVIREDLKPFKDSNPAVKDYDAVGGGMRPFLLNILGNDPELLEKYALQVFEWVKTHPGLKDVDVNYRPGKPELQVKMDPAKADAMGISTVMLGTELRAQIEGAVTSKYREQGREYDVRVRFQEDQRDLRTQFPKIFVPNINGTLVRLADVATPVLAQGPAKITRQDRGRYIQIQADIAPSGPGMGQVMTDIENKLKGDLKIPEGMRYAFIGQAENFKELGESMATAMGLGVLFIFLVLASLYESFVTPLTIMLALPLGLCGAFVALFFAHESLNIFSMIGVIMLLGVATKNSILLVDYANQLIRDGKTRSEALIISGRTRLRPILMTTMALIAGTIPVAIGLNEASKQRTSMGVAIIGGLVSSTLLTLVVVPAAFSFLDRFRIWSRDLLAKMFMDQGT